MAENKIVIELEEEAYKNFMAQAKEMTRAAQDATCAMKEFGATWQSIKGRYHPVIWWILSLFARREK